MLLGICRYVLAMGVAALILCKLAMTAHAQNASADEAARLIRAMGMDHAALQSLQLPLTLGQRRNADRVLSDREKRFYECISSVDSAIYVPELSGELLRHMTREDILQATNFYETDLGKKVREQDHSILQTMLNGGVPKQELSEAELNELKRFEQTTAGRKVQGVLNSLSFVRLLSDTNEKVKRDCAKRS